MRYIILALALVFGLGNADESIEQMVDRGAYEEAFERAQIAANRGDAEAHDWLGWFYENGNGVAADMESAEAHYRVAAGLGDDHARWRLGVLIDEGKLSGSLEEAVALFEANAANDYSNGIVSLAVMQATGRGTPLDYDAALASYMRAARLGDSGGVRGVGVMFYHGQAVEQDPEEALAWFLISAGMGNEDGESSFYAVAEELPDTDLGQVQERAFRIAEELGLEISDDGEAEEPTDSSPS
ncbi:tetratricopeptide repeat protein [Erythrobacter sp. JK5]|uniref:tetratricopeptide repeat protein n=1 Tax=Erythrobacter sp. JK5 TaxID=2829500 RepID=UPI001BAE4ABA|nr:tetratricopeptide repeat protein [Erythrobacter sp. JK5]QUL37092.1 sel1 repeat family protein [Erythrobacter sp. JK5]